MKISKEEKERTRRRLVDAAVHVIAERGFRGATMREIADEADVGEATIYKYFPTKERLLFGFFEVRLEDLLERLKAIPDFHQYQFQEQFHVLLETQLALFAADRAFLRTAYRGVFLTNWISTATAAKATKDRFIAIVDDLVVSAVEAGEFEEPPFKKLFYEFLWEYAIGVTYYWLEDDSPNYVRTTQMLDKSLSVLNAVLMSKVLSRTMDLAQFLVREHVLARIQRVGRSPVPRRPKREFMAADAAAQPAPKRKRARHAKA